MTRILLPLLLLAGCATHSQPPHAPVRSVSYQAIGSQPFWVLTIGDDRIVFWPVNGNEQRIWPRTLPRTEDGRRIWQSGEGADGITVEARPGPCSSDEERLYEDFVQVRTGDEGATLEGCGGRLVRRGGRR